MFITAGYVDLAIGTATRTSYAPSTAAFNQYEAQARAAVQAACQVAGYSIGNTSSNATIQLLTLGQWVFYAGGLRHGIQVPPAISDAINKLDAVRRGDMPIPGLSPSTRDGIAGVKFSDTGTGTGSRPQYLSRSKLETW